MALAAGGAGAGALVVGPPAMEAQSWIGNTLSSLWGKVKIYAGMAHSRLTAPRRRNTLDEILTYTEKAEYIPPSWLTKLSESGAIDKKLIDTAIVAGKRAHGAAFSVLRSYMIYQNTYAASTKGSNVSLRTDLRIATEQLFENILLYNVYTYFKYLNRANLRRIAASRGSGISVSNLASESQNIATVSSLWGESHIVFDAMPYELCQRLNAIVLMNPSLAANYLLEASPEAGVYTKPPKIIGLPDVDESTEEELGAAMESAISRAEDILVAIERLWNDAASKDIPSKDFSKALIALIRTKKNTSAGASRIASAFDSIIGAGAIAGALEHTGENYSGSAAIAPAPAPAPATLSSSAAAAAAVSGVGAKRRKANSDDEEDTNVENRPKGRPRLLEESTGAMSTSNSAASTNKSAGVGQGGGARRRIRRHRRTHRKHNSCKTKTYRRSRARKTRRQH